MTRPRFDEATLAQITAAKPDASTWLAANAGSGKTRVLTDRVARLLLEGVLPEHILCLTYTKAAATEMQNRLFKRLGSWAMKDDATLAQEMRQLGVEATLDTEYLRSARTLFARAIEAPGGLRIQTIHAFCAALLRRFPLEAGVSPQFKEMEGRAADLLREEILDTMAEGPEAGLIADLAPYVTDDLAPLLRNISGARGDFLPPRSEEILAGAYGIAPGARFQDLLADVFLGSEAAIVESVLPLLQGGTSTDQKLATALAPFDTADAAGFAVLEKALLTQAGTPRKTLGTKKTVAAAPGSFEQLSQLANRVAEAVQARHGLDALVRDRALHRFSCAFLAHYDAEKSRRGWLDFDDLIQRTRDLLQDPAVAEWVLYRLDGGIDHILVDEAQDTSPVQWQVIERLAQEFTSGQGARSDISRTIFVVGDKKQSIYSFQGADPSGFDRMREAFAERLAETAAPLAARMLEFSFRSAPPVLTLVDQVFVGREDSGFAPEQKHRAFNGDLPGRVELWPVVQEAEKDEESAWDDPLDRVSETHHSVVLAQKVARRVRAMIDQASLPERKDGQLVARPITAGDILVLVRSRSQLFAEIIRACKQEGIPIAGADRMKVMAELAVRDIMAVLRFLATPEDDLSLATALRSPLFGLSEQALYSLAQPRGERYLWQHLRAERDRHPAVLNLLDDLRAQVDFLRPYDLIDRLLTRHGGRARILGRLGPEAEDGIDALLAQALAYEAEDVPSLTGFLHWAEEDSLEIKRAPDGGGVLRVMTVHGSKGLEAPIVILPDCGKPKTGDKATLVSDEAGAMFKRPEASRPERQGTALEAKQTKAAQEDDRLLYVALTRAEKWLIVAASGDLGQSGKSWWEAVEQGMQRAGAVEDTLDPLGHEPDSGLVLATPWADLPRFNPEPATGPETAILPEALRLPPPAPLAPPAIVQPSELGGAKALPGPEGEPEELAKTRGTLIHALLEHLAPLPDSLRQAAGLTLLEDLLTQPEATPLADHAEALLSEALAVLRSPDLARFFDATALAEVPVTAVLPGLGRMHGIIDRLVITPDMVCAVDFKSNRQVPGHAQATPKGILRQMGAYSAALGTIYPDRRIEVGLIWTRQALYMPLSHELVTQALAEVTLS